MPCSVKGRKKDEKTFTNSEWVKKGASEHCRDAADALARVSLVRPLELFYGSFHTMLRLPSYGMQLQCGSGMCGSNFQMFECGLYTHYQPPERREWTEVNKVRT